MEKKNFVGTGKREKKKKKGGGPGGGKGNAKKKKSKAVGIWGQTFSKAQKSTSQSRAKSKKMGKRKGVGSAKKGVADSPPVGVALEKAKKEGVEKRRIFFETHRKGEKVETLARKPRQRGKKNTTRGGRTRKKIEQCQKKFGRKPPGGKKKGIPPGSKTPAAHGFSWGSKRASPEEDKQPKKRGSAHRITK